MSIDVHRWVALTFFGTAEGREVNHKNGNKGDPAVSNLEYSTRGANMTHAYKTGLAKSRTGQPLRKLTVADVIVIRASGKSQRLLALEFSVSPSAIADVLAKRTWR